jgi:DNA-binding beta-propeller fold protein YncE
MARSVFRTGIALALFACALIWPATAHAYGYYWVTGWGPFDLPMGVAVDTAGNVYEVARNTDRVEKFTNDGQFILGWDIGPRATTLHAIAVDGGYVYVADAYHDRIMKFTTEGVYVTEWGSFGSGNGQMDEPDGIAIGPDHSVYVADYENHRVQKFTSAGAYLTQWGDYDLGNGVQFQPKGMVCDPAGNLYVTDFNIGQIAVFTSQGQFITKWGWLTLGHPTDIDIDSNGDLYISDYFYNQISKWTTSGVAIETFGTSGSGYNQLNQPWSVAVDADGEVFVADYQNLRVQKFAPCPFPTVTGQPEPLALPFGATAVFSVTAPNAVSYQWVKDGDWLNDGPRTTGAQSGILTITDFQASDLGSYWCEVRNLCNQANESDHVALSEATTPSCFGPPAPPPTGMAAWWAMDDGPGNTVPDVLHPVGNKNHASRTGAATLVAGKVGTAVRCNGVNDGLHVPSTLSPRLAATSTGLSIDAWLLPRSGSSPNAYRMILQKGLLKKQTTTSGGVTALAPGYAFYLCNGGRMGFQMPGLDYEPARFEPSMPAMSMDEWHHVAVTVQPQAPGGGKFYLDGVEVGSFTPPSGILGNLADLYIGRFTPQLGPATPDSAFNGDIDEVEIFVTAIDSASVRKIWSAGCSGKRRVQVLANSNVSLRESSASAEICFAVQNLSKDERSYQWSIAASGPSAGCPSSVPVTFTASSGSVTVSAGQRADLSTTASVSPGALTAPFTRCYTLTVTDVGDGGVMTAGGSITFSGEKVTGKAACAPPEIGDITVVASATQSASGVATFTLVNDGPSGVTVPFRVQTRDPETGAPSSVLRLEGQPAGTPWTGSLFVPAGGSAPLPVDVTLDEYEPFLPDEIVLATDLDGNLAYDDVASTHVASGSDTSLALVGVGPAPGMSAHGFSLHAAPNPFGTNTALMFRLAQATRVEVDILDVSGRRVRRVTSARLEQGVRRVTWDGRDEAGAAVPAGVYLARVRAGADQSVVRLLRLR